MSNVDIFIEEYKKLEESVRRVYNLRYDQSIVHELKVQRQFQKYKEKIQSCADLRNFYQHDSKINNEFVVDVSDEAISFLKMLTDLVNNRRTCRDICTPYQDIIWRTIDDTVKDTVKLMDEKSIANVPILQDGRVIGVFDRRSLFSYVANNDDDTVELDNKLTFKDLNAYISIDTRNMEDIVFCSINKSVDDVVEVFESKMNQGKRLGLVLLTLTGKQNEKLLGLLAPCDIICSF